MYIYIIYILYIYITSVIIIKNYLPHNSTHKVIVYGYKNCYLCFYLPTSLSYKWLYWMYI